MSIEREWKAATRAIRLGHHRTEEGEHSPPIFTTSSYVYESAAQAAARFSGDEPGNIYSRFTNPTVRAFEQRLAALEGGESCVATASGMAAVFLATHPFLALNADPTHPNGRGAAEPMNIVASAKCYGGTFMLFRERYGAERGVEVRWVRDELNLDEWASKIDDHTRFVYGEMPSNPGLAVFDIAAVADLAHRHGVPLIVDSTIATPALLRPLCHGADIVVHSVSKAMTTSGFAIAGAVIARHNIVSRVGPEEMRANFALYAKLLPGRDHGPAMSPFAAMMILNDLRTLRDKVDRMSRNAMQVAEFLAQHPAVEAVYYPGLPTFAGHAMAKRYMWLADGEDDYGEPVNRYGHLMGFTVKGGAQATRQFFDHLQMVWRATDLGRIKTVATIPAISTHQQQGEEGRQLASVPANLVRLSTGTEHPADIIADLERALAAVRQPAAA